MSKVISLLGLLQLLAGAGVLVIAPTSVHQILGAVALGFGTLGLGIGSVIDRLPPPYMKSENANAFEVKDRSQRGWTRQT